MVGVEGEGHHRLVRDVDGEADAVPGGAPEAEPRIVGRVPEYDDEALAQLLGSPQRGAATAVDSDVRLGGQRR